MQLDTFKTRFESKCIPEPNSGCWLWEGAVWMQGRYGAFWLGKEFNKGRMVGAHVASLFLYSYIRPSKGQEVCHTCDNTLCVNPNHLFVGTHLDNMRDMAQKGRAAESRRKLTSDQVLEARTLRSDKLQVKEIASIFGISRSHMSRVVRGVLRKNTVCQ